MHVSRETTWYVDFNALSRELDDRLCLPDYGYYNVSLILC